METTQMTEVLRLMTDITVFNFKVENSVLEEIRLFLTRQKIDIDPEKLEKHEYIKCGEEIKSKLLIYFHLNNNFSRNKLVKSLKSSIEKYESTLEDFTFSQKLYCPCCKTEMIGEFKNTKKPYLTNLPVCPQCKHKISSLKIYADCECERCKKAINLTYSFFKDLKKNIEKEVEEVYKTVLQNCNKQISKNTDTRLRWYANKYSSDLSKTEREIISFQPISVEELYEEFQKKNFKELEKTLLHKKITYKRYLPHEISYILNSILKSMSIQMTVSHDYGKSPESVSFSEIDFSNLTISSIVADKNYDNGILHINWNGISIPQKYQNQRFTQIDTCKYVFNRRFFQNIVSESQCYSTEDKLNPHYFNKIDISNNAIRDENKIKPLFNSIAEESQYLRLRQIYADYILIPNMPLRCFANKEFIEANFKNAELQYVQNCIVDFVILTQEGFPIKAIEVQRGSHHDTEEYIKKDNLKRRAIQLCGLLYEETY